MDARARARLVFHGAVVVNSQRHDSVTLSLFTTTVNGLPAG